MPRANPLKQIVVKQRGGKPVGIYSCCSTNDYVIEVALEYVRRDDSCVLIEATADQVDQNGGYTGATPKDPRESVLKKAKAIDVDESRTFLGGDHLGPLTSVALPEREAMEKAEELVHCYVAIGFTKIHIDTNMKIVDDGPNIRLDDAVTTRRSAYLAHICEETYRELLKQNPDAIRPVYIAGNEVPISGGAQKEGTGMQVTRVENSKDTVETFERVFTAEELKETWKDVVDAAVQPGVEEKDDGCTGYGRSKARNLTASTRKHPNLIFEGHSTDCQIKFKLRELIEDGVGILKADPELTYAVRKALSMLANIETAVYYGKEEALSNSIGVLEEAMMEEPKSWKKHHHGGDSALWSKRKYNFSDCSRHYMPNPNVATAKNKLTANLCKSGIPLSVLSQSMPIQYTKVHKGHLENDPEVLIRDRAINTVDEYLYVTHQETLF